MGGAGEGGKAVQIEADAGMGGADVAAFGASLGRGGPGGASKETRPGRGAGGVLGEESWSEVGVEEVFEYVAAAVAGTDAVSVAATVAGAQPAPVRYRHRHHRQPATTDVTSVLIQAPE